MKTTTNNVLVFQTNIRSANETEKLRPWLDEHPEVHRWTVDHDDVDGVLRIETTGLSSTAVENLVSAAGFVCQEMPD